MKRSLRVAMDDVLDAMTMPAHGAVSFFLDVDTGNVEIVTEDLPDDDEGPDLDDTERYHEIPKLERSEEYNLMLRFAESVGDEDIGDLLDASLKGAGAFSRFRDVVFRYHDLKARWFAQRQQVLLEDAKRWLASLGIDPVYELRRIEQAEAAPPVRPSGRAGLELLDVLLLGAPDGKTELLNGRVLRQVRCASGDEARAVFKRLARELCGHFGLPWRRRLVEGKSSFVAERARLQVVEGVVELWIDVSPATWKLFSR